MSVTKGEKGKQTNSKTMKKNKTSKTTFFFEVGNEKIEVVASSESEASARLGKMGLNGKLVGSMDGAVSLIETRKLEHIKSNDKPLQTMKAKIPKR